MKKVFLDTNVIIDFLTRRSPFEIESMKLFEYSSRKRLKIHISSLTISDIYYIISRLENKNIARENIKTLLQLVEILPVGKKIIEKSVLSDFKDVEDGIQNFCAKEANLKIIITRDTKDYIESDLSIMTPIEFLAEFEKE